MRKYLEEIQTQWRQIDSKRRATYRNIISVIFTPLWVLFMVQLLVPFGESLEGNVIVYYPFLFLTRMEEQLVTNYLFFLFLYGILFWLPKYKITSLIVTAAFFLLGLAQHHVAFYKSDLLYPRDIQNLSLARDVSLGYSFIFNHHIVLALLFFIVSALFAFLGKTKHISWTKRLVSSGVALVLLLCFVFGFALVPLRQEKIQRGYHVFSPLANLTSNGLVMTYFYFASLDDILEPENYSEEKAINMLNQYESEIEDVTDYDYLQPDIIVIVNESLTDYESLFDIETSSPILPFYHSLEGNNVVKTDLFCSIFAGSTANTETEVLTGHSLYFFPPGSYPFLNTFKENTYSIVRSYSEAGYRTIYVHPFRSDGWNRTDVIPFLGFEESYFLNDFDHPELIRDYVSDGASYQFIIDLYEQHKSNWPNRPLFQYLLTMQNHGGYEKEDFESTIKLMQTDNYPGAEQYFSLIRLSDDELENLIEYFDRVEDPVVIIYFGDHQPAIPGHFDLYLHEEIMSSYDPRLQQYVTPIMYWANFDLSSYSIGQIDLSIMSPNFILPLISDMTGVQDPYTFFLIEIQKEMQSINARGIIDAEGQYHPYGSESLGKREQILLNEYEILQYYLLTKVMED